MPLPAQNPAQMGKFRRWTISPVWMHPYITREICFVIRPVYLSPAEVTV